MVLLVLYLFFWSASDGPTGAPKGMALHGASGDGVCNGAWGLADGDGCSGWTPRRRRWMSWMDTIRQGLHAHAIQRSSGLRQIVGKSAYETRRPRNVA